MPYGCSKGRQPTWLKGKTDQASLTSCLNRRVALAKVEGSSLELVVDVGSPDINPSRDQQTPALATRLNPLYAHARGRPPGITAAAGTSISEANSLQVESRQGSIER